jgi:hypothetical protein
LVYVPIDLFPEYLKDIKRQHGNKPIQKLKIRDHIQVHVLFIGVGILKLQHLPPEELAKLKHVGVVLYAIKDLRIQRNECCSNSTTQVCKLAEELGLCEPVVESKFALNNVYLIYNATLNILRDH